LALAGRGRSPVARVLAQALRGQQRGLPEAKVREEVIRSGGEMLEALRAWFRPLEVIASLAPLLGLFGTVLGMIEAFQQLEQAGSQVNPAILSGGIWEALLTTAVVLAVAMPCVALLNWMERVVDRLAHEMENVVTQVFTEDLSMASEESERHEPPHESPGLRPAAALAGE
ncbi:MAG: MotA/TolQ/ExbB proton channel family protein, partial [Kiloniellales bacterium]